MTISCHFHNKAVGAVLVSPIDGYKCHPSSLMDNLSSSLSSISRIFQDLHSKPATRSHSVTTRTTKPVKMQFFTFAALFAATAVAAPTNVGPDVCGSGVLNNNLRCCDTDILGVLSINCVVPNQVPINAIDFQRICAKMGQSPKCCALPVAGQALVCNKPVGV
ncbi:Hydrophobin [Tolypocladium paradoxum]|uniref:Hydrophobin n=1 Tax=Tolypocladium paradoxum TaxID=94208 RepID=A0A2S4L6Z6_9HYPO|nr:Hydrophobin [Tolypocladium paradoxum]